MRYHIIFFLMAMCLYLTGNTQNITNKGTEFWVGYGHHQYMEPGCNGTPAAPNDMNMVLYLSAEEATDVTVTIDSSGPFPALWFSKTYHLAANTVISTENLPKGPDNSAVSSSNPNYDARLYTDPPPSGSGGEGIFRGKGIHIVSQKPIVAYAHIYGGVSSAATMLMPVTAWGYSYTSMNSEQRDADRSYSWMYIIAKENNTVVRITPSVISRLGKPANQSFDVLLQKGQIYQLVGQANCATGDGPELTGTTVRSVAGPDNECHAIAVFSGSSRTGGETFTCGTGSGRDNDMQQLFPEQTWGKRYLTAPFSKSSGSTPAPSQFQTSVFKVLVKDPATVVLLNGRRLTGLIANKYYKFSSNTTDSIIADKPVMVGQFMSGTSACNGGDGDPEMVYLSPMEQAIKRIGFYRNTRQSINVNFLTLIVPSDGVRSLKIDGSSSFYTYPHATPNYTVVVKGWTASQSQCIVTCDSAFTAITYGLGGAESYAYNAGTYLNNLNGISDLNNISDTTNHGQNSHLFTCKGSPVRLSILMRYQPTKLVWQLSALGNAISPNADVTLDPASSAFQGNVTVNGVPYFKYSLPATYVFNTDGKYDVSVFSTSPSLTENCNNTEELIISYDVRPSPTADFTFSNASGCVREITSFFGPAATGISAAQQWLWTFPGNIVSSHQDTAVALSVSGDVTLRVISKEGCVANVTKAVNLVPAPTATVTHIPVSVCEGNSIVFTPAASYTGPEPVNSFYWDFADSHTVTTTTATPQTVLYDKAGTYDVKMVAGTSQLCVSDTVHTVVTVYSKPQVDITYSAGCLPANGIVLFSNHTTTPDGQTLAGHVWDFDDAAATPANPNTSTAESPSHTYSSGHYDIHYTVTSSQGCVKDTVIKAAFSLTPVIQYPVLAAVCENAASFSVATATVTNGVAGAFSYSGTGTDASGLFQPAVARAGTHVITATYTSSDGCTVSAGESIEVYALPAAAFTVSAHACINDAVTITPAAGATIQTWGWDLGNGNTRTTYNSNAFTTTYTAVNNYTIRLITTGLNGCASLPATAAVAVHPLPVADFDVPLKICLPGTALFHNTSRVADNSALTYLWNFGDGGSAPDTDPAHAYARAGSYPATVTATSVYGCKHTSAVKYVSDFYQRPVADFSVLPNEICEGAVVRFSDISTPAGAVITRSWDFGDGSPLVTAASPEKKYAAAGAYTIRLTVGNQDGCSAILSRGVTVHLQPKIDAGKSFAVPEGTVVRFEATSNSPLLSLSWSPPASLSDPAALQPTLRVTRDETYTLTALGAFNCMASDWLTVTVLKTVVAPNAFSPNGDRINDRWVISNLADYPSCMVQVFNRYGQKVFESKGYSTPWDGRSGGGDLPMGTYYYVIRLGDGSPPLTGSVTIIR